MYTYSLQGRSLSLKSGADVVHKINIPERYHAIDVFVDRDGCRLMVSTYTAESGIDSISGVRKKTRIYSLASYELEFNFDSFQYTHKTI